MVTLQTLSVVIGFMVIKIRVTKLMFYFITYVIYFLSDQ